MAEYTIDKFTYNGNTYKLKSSTLKNLVDGSQTGSVRGINTIAEDSNYTIGYGAVAVGISTKASGSGAFAEGGGTQAIAIASHAEGGSTTASGEYAHAEGSSTTASNSESHAEGSQSTASGATSHAEGKGTNATGQYSHAEGYYNTTSGLAAHAEGNQTTANHAYQHVFGSFNIADGSTATATNKGNYIEIVGNGTSNSARANARTLDWSGNEVLAGKLTLGAAGVNSMDAATVGQIPNVDDINPYTADSPIDISDGTELFSETTTTEYSDGYYYISLSYGDFINTSAIDVVFEGTTYTCPKQVIENGVMTAYGAPFDSLADYYEPSDWSEYPFQIYSDNGMANELRTETAGTYEIIVSKRDTIYHENSGVIAGTYDGGAVKGTGFYVPSITVNAEGHITSATDLGNLISIVNNNHVANPETPVLTTGYSYSSKVTSINRYTTDANYRYILPAHSISKSFSITHSELGIYFKVIGVNAFDMTNYEPVIVDWKTNYLAGYNGMGTVTLTITIAEEFDCDIMIDPIITYGAPYGGM